MKEEDFQRLVFEKLLTMEEKMASKDDLLRMKEEMASKDDLLRMKEEMASKDDLLRMEEKMASKDDLLRMEEKMASKDDLLRMEEKIDHLSSEGQNDIKALLEIINKKLDDKVTREDIESLTGIIKLLSTRSIQHEAEIEKMKHALR